MTNEPYDLEINWTFPQAAAEVFTAWISADQLAEWWSFPGYSIPPDRVTVEPRIGGIWSVTAVSDDDGSEIPFTGTITEIESGRRLVIALGEPKSDGHRSEMVVETRDTADGSSMEFHHHALGDKEEADELRGGYEGFFFPSLTAYLAPEQ
ncbi:MAG TPA: SRPBCC domain-containing protein [Galbitalea sp.]|jgi:uncharacterized protein YndB with AHSA1/START domain|nr:SRPBCC domain-containing protein [Galbitalea sp.]